MVQPPTWALVAADAVRHFSLRSSQPRHALTSTAEPLPERIKRLHAAWWHSRVSDGSRAARFNRSLFEAAVEHSSLKQQLNASVTNAVLELGMDLALQNRNVFDSPEIDLTRSLTAREARHLLDQLTEVQTRIEHDGRIHELFAEGICALFIHLLDCLPARTFDDDGAHFSIPLHAVTGTREFLADVLHIFLNDLVPETSDAIAALAFEATRLQLWQNLLRISHMTPDQVETAPHKIIGPHDCTLTPAEMIEAYLGGTPLSAFARTPVPFSLPHETRFEHCHVVGGTGHGKTQLLQLLIHHDLQETQRDGRSIVVIDSQGDLIRTISRLSCFDPGVEESLAARFMLIDPYDIEFPVALNMFDVNMERINAFPALEREKVLNGTIELYEYIFGALLGAELTQKQGLIFRYLARLMMVIPGANIHTLRELLEDGRRFSEHFSKLEGTARQFFETEFMRPNFQATKTQALRRLWGVLANPTFERMFSHEKNKVDLFDAMNSGKIIFINTAKDLLKQEGCTIFGRFFIAMIAQAALQRAAIPANERRDTFVFVDEAHDYFDDTIEQLLNQARKYRIGLTLSHQNLDQLSQRLRASIMASTSIKLVGGMSAKDAKAFAPDMHTTSEFLQGMHKSARHTEFACFIKNATPHALKVSVPLGLINDLPQVSSDAFEQLVARNRDAYCAPLADIPPVVPHFDEAEVAAEPEAPSSAEAAEAVPDKPHVDERVDGSTTHRHIQNELKAAAQAHGFSAVVEQQVLDGAGSVDVAINWENRSIACEVSITTKPEHELRNVEKCLSAGFDEVWVIAADPDHLENLKAHITPRIDEPARSGLHFLAPEEALARIGELSVRQTVRQDRVFGYEVVIQQQLLSETERAARRQALNNLFSRNNRRVEDCQ